MFTRLHIAALGVLASVLVTALSPAYAQCTWDDDPDPANIGIPGVVGGVRLLLGVPADPYLGGPALYATGYFTEADGQPANHIARWDPVTATWSAVGEGLPEPRAMAIFNDELYVGTEGGRRPLPKQYLARWDGSEWSVFAEVDGGVQDMAVVDGKLYVGGNFETVDDLTVNGIAAFDGASWSDLTGGLTRQDKNKRVAGDIARHGMVVSEDGSSLYVSGDFDQAGSVPANCVAAWNGTAWSALGGGVDSGGPLAVGGGRLYTGFFYGRRPTTWEVWEWNGAAWSRVGGTQEGYLRSLAFFNGSVHVGGLFDVDTDGGVATNIVHWRDGAWTPVGDPPLCCFGVVWALTVFDDADGIPYLFTGGYGMYETAGETVRGVAKLSCD